MTPNELISLAGPATLHIDDDEPGEIPVVACQMMIERGAQEFFAVLGGAVLANLQAEEKHTTVLGELAWAEDLDDLDPVVVNACLHFMVIGFVNVLRDALVMWIADMDDPGAAAEPTPG